LLLLGVVQDVAHAGDRTCVPSRRQRLDRYREWPVFSCRLMAGLGCPPKDEIHACDETMTGEIRALQAGGVGGPRG
jgi:hypothetical protein